VRRRTPSHFQAADEVVLLLGATRDELDGSEWAHVVHGHLGGLPPAVDLEAERTLAALLADASRDSLVTSAHDLSEGGLAQALVEASFRHGIGVSVSVSDVAHDPFVALFSESAARAIVTVTTDSLEAFSTAASAHGVPVTRLGTTGGDALVVEDEFELPVAEARAAWSATLPDALA
jgi:phosphoribosylformylglycinamidine synthase